MPNSWTCLAKEEALGIDQASNDVDDCHGYWQEIYCVFTNCQQTIRLTQVMNEQERYPLQGSKMGKIVKCSDKERNLDKQAY